jgi:glycosyltransferase involved in cell wall biosynthesis
MDAMRDAAERHAPPRRVAFVTAALGPGGAERVISLLASHWARSGWRVTIVTFDAPGERLYHPLNGGVRLRRLGIPPGKNNRARTASLLARLRALRATLRDDQPDIVLSFLTKINALTLAATIGMGLPVTVSERNNPQRQTAHPLWNVVLRLLYRRATAIVCQTERAIACLPPGVRAKAVVIPNPIEAPPGLAAAPGSDPPWHIAAVGRLTRQKGFDLLIPAFARAVADHPGWQLDIWGEGPERGALQAMLHAYRLPARAGLRGVSPIQGGWAEGASAFVLPSRYEGFPNVLGEAMACGLPVIAFDCPFGPGEMIHHGIDGLLVPDGDTAALTDALSRIMTSAPLRAALGGHAARAMRRLAPALVVREWERLVARLAPLPAEYPAR